MKQYLSDHKEFFERQSDPEVRTRGLFLLEEVLARHRFLERFGIDMGEDFKPITMKQLQQRYLRAVIGEHFGGNMMLARQTLGVSLATLYRLQNSIEE